MNDNQKIKEIKVFLGRLGHEQFLGELEEDLSIWRPAKGELISIGNRNQGEDIVYQIIQVLTDYSRIGDADYPFDTPEINLFVEEYFWD